MLKLAIGVGLLVVILLTFGTTKSCVSAYKDRKADEAIAEERAKGEEHRKKADEAEAKAKALETDKKIAELAIEAISKENAKKQELLKAEDARATEDAERAGQDVDAAERCRRLCDRARKLKLIAANADCGC
jgi:hypothetical protein